jgi:hypothetical protein
MTALLRPFTVGELLDGAFSLYRRNFTSFFATALVPYLPLVIVWLVLAVLAGSSGPAVMAAVAMLAAPYSTLAVVLIWASLAFASMRGFESAQHVSAGEALGVGLRKLPITLLASFVAVVLMVSGSITMAIPGLLIPGALLTIVLALTFAAMFFAIVPAIVVENRGPFDALGRSRRLSKGARVRILVVVLLAFIIAWLPVVAFSFIAGMAVAVGVSAAAPTENIAGGWWYALLQAGSHVLNALTIPYSVAAVTLLYVDRRARTEAPDLEEAAARLTEV